MTAPMVGTVPQHKDNIVFLGWVPSGKADIRENQKKRLYFDFMPCSPAPNDLPVPIEKRVWI